MRKLKNRFMSTQTGGEGETIQSQPEITTNAQELTKNVVPVNTSTDQPSIPENIQPVDVGQEQPQASDVSTAQQPQLDKIEMEVPTGDGTTPSPVKNSPVDLVNRDEKPIEGLNVTSPILPIETLNDDGTKEDILIPSYQSSIPLLSVPEFNFNGDPVQYRFEEIEMPDFKSYDDKLEYERSQELSKFSQPVVEYFDEVEKKEAQKNEQIKRNNDILRGTKPKETSYDKIANEVSVGGFSNIEETRKFKDIKYAPSANMETFMSLFSLDEDEITRISESAAGLQSMTRVRDYANTMSGYSTELEHINTLENILKSGRADEAVNLRHVTPSVSLPGQAPSAIGQGTITSQQAALIRQDIEKAKKIAGDLKNTLDNFDNEAKIDPKNFDDSDRNKQSDLYAKFENQTNKKLKSIYGTRWKEVRLETYGGDQSVRYELPEYRTFDIKGSNGPGEEPQYFKLEDVKRIKEYTKWLDKEGKNLIASDIKNGTTTFMDAERNRFNMSGGGMSYAMEIRNDLFEIEAHKHFNETGNVDNFTYSGFKATAKRLAKENQVKVNSAIKEASDIVLQNGKAQEEEWLSSNKKILMNQINDAKVKMDALFKDTLETALSSNPEAMQIYNDYSSRISESQDPAEKKKLSSEMMASLKKYPVISKAFNEYENAIDGFVQRAQANFFSEYAVQKQEIYDNAVKDLQAGISKSIKEVYRSGINNDLNVYEMSNKVVNSKEFKEAGFYGKRKMISDAWDREKAAITSMVKSGNVKFPKTDEERGKHWSQWTGVRAMTEQEKNKWNSELAKRTGNDARNRFIFYAVDDLLYSKKGKPTVYAIQSFAKEQLTEISAKKKALGIKDYDEVIGGFGRSKYAISQDEAKQMLLTEQYLNKIINTPETDQGAWSELLNGFSDGFQVPFLGALLGIQQKNTLMGAVDRYQTDAMDTYDISLVDAYSAMNKLAELKPNSAYYNIGSGLGFTSTFMMEMVALGGFNAIGRGFGAKVTESLLNIGKSSTDDVVRASVETASQSPAFGERVKSIVSFFTGGMVEGAVNPRAYEMSLERMIDTVTVQESGAYDGLISTVDRNSGEGTFEAFLKGYGNWMGMTTIERLGAHLPSTKLSQNVAQYLGTSTFMKRAFIGKFMRDYGFKSVDEAAEYISTNSIPWSGFVPEMMEEVLQGGWESIITGDDPLFGMDAPEAMGGEMHYMGMTADELKTTAAVVGIFGSVMNVGRNVVARVNGTNNTVSIETTDDNGISSIANMDKSTWDKYNSMMSDENLTWRSLTQMMQEDESLSPDQEAAIANVLIQMRGKEILEDESYQEWKKENSSILEKQATIAQEVKDTRQKAYDALTADQKKDLVELGAAAAYDYSSVGGVLSAEDFAKDPQANEKWNVFSLIYQNEERLSNPTMTVETEDENGEVTTQTVESTSESIADKKRKRKDKKLTRGGARGARKVSKQREEAEKKEEAPVEAPVETETKEEEGIQFDMPKAEGGKIDWDTMNEAEKRIQLEKNQLEALTIDSPELDAADPNRAEKVKKYKEQLKLLNENPVEYFKQRLESTDANAPYYEEFKQQYDTVLEGYKPTESTITTPIDLTDDTEDITGVSGQVREGQEPVQAEPIAETGQEAPSPSGVVQETEEIKAKKADIERRRQERLTPVSKENPKGYFENTGVYKKDKTTGEEYYDPDTKNGTYSVDFSEDEEIDDFIDANSIEELKTKINAKYDEELEGLDESVTTEATAQEESDKPREIKFLWETEKEEPTAAKEEVKPAPVTPETQDQIDALNDRINEIYDNGQEDTESGAAELKILNKRIQELESGKKQDRKSKREKATPKTEPKATTPKQESSDILDENGSFTNAYANKIIDEIIGAFGTRQASMVAKALRKAGFNIPYAYENSGVPISIYLGESTDILKSEYNVSTKEEKAKATEELTKLAERLGVKVGSDVESAPMAEEESTEVEEAAPVADQEVIPEEEDQVPDAVKSFRDRLLNLYEKTPKRSTKQYISGQQNSIDPIEREAAKLALEEIERREKDQAKSKRASRGKTTEPKAKVDSDGFVSVESNNRGINNKAEYDETGKLKPKGFYSVSISEDGQRATVKDTTGKVVVNNAKISQSESGTRFVVAPGGTSVYVDKTVMSSIPTAEKAQEEKPTTGEYKKRVSSFYDPGKKTTKSTISPKAAEIEKDLQYDPKSEDFNSSDLRSAGIVDPLGKPYGKQIDDARSKKQITEEEHKVLTDFYEQKKKEYYNNRAKTQEQKEAEKIRESASQIIEKAITSEDTTPEEAEALQDDSARIAVEVALTDTKNNKKPKNKPGLSASRRRGATIGLVETLLTRLQKAFPGYINGIDTDQQSFQAAARATGRSLNSAAIIFNGIVYLNDRVANDNTAMEEFAHIYLLVMKANNLPLYKKGINMVQTDAFEYIEEVMNDPGYDYIHSGQSWEDLSQKEKEDVAFEAVSKMIADKGEAILEQKRKSPIMTFLKDFWKNMARLLKAFSGKLDVARDDLNTYTELIAKELLRGRPISTVTPERVSALIETKKGRIGYVPLSSSSIMNFKAGWRSSARRLFAANKGVGEDLGMKLKQPTRKVAALENQVKLVVKELNKAVDDYIYAETLDGNKVDKAKLLVDIDRALKDPEFRANMFSADPIAKNLLEPVVMKMRGMVDSLSKELAMSGRFGDTLVASINANQDMYLHTSYFVFSKSTEAARENWLENFSDQDRDEILDWISDGGYSKAVKMNYKINSTTGAITVSFVNSFGHSTTDQVTFNDLDALKDYIKQNVKSVVGAVPASIDNYVFNSNEGTIELGNAMNIDSTGLGFAVDDNHLIASINEMVRTNKEGLTDLLNLQQQIVSSAEASIKKKKQKQMNEAKKKFLMEIEDPAYNFANTISKQASLLYKSELEKALIDTGYLAIDGQTNPAGEKGAASSNWRRVTNVNSELYNKWIPTEIYDMLFGTDLINDKALSQFGIGRFFYGASAMTKMALTILSPGSNAANYVSGWFQLAKTGGLPITLMNTYHKAALRAVEQELDNEGEAAYTMMNFVPALLRHLTKVTGSSKAISNMNIPLSPVQAARYGTDDFNSLKPNEQAQVLADELVEMGIINSGIESEALRNLSEYAFNGVDVPDNVLRQQISNLTTIKKAARRTGRAISRAGAKTITSFADAYSFSDSVFKAMMYMNHKEFNMRTYGEEMRRNGMSPDQIDAAIKTKTAQQVRMQMPTYDRSPEFLRFLSRFPLLGPFVQFDFQNKINDKNILLDGGRMMFVDAPRMMQNGMTKEAASVFAKGSYKVGMAISSQFLAYSIYSLISSGFGWDDDDDEAMRKTQPEYRAYNALIHMDSNKTGVHTFIDINRVMPQALYLKYWRAFKEDGFEEGLKQFFEPYVQEDVFTGALVNTFMGINKYGVYDPYLAELGRFDKLQYLLTERLLPSTAYGQVEKVIRAARGEEAMEGVPADAVNEVMNMALGIKIRSVRLDKTFGQKVAYGDVKDIETQKLRLKQIIKERDKRVEQMERGVEAATQEDIQRINDEVAEEYNKFTTFVNDKMQALYDLADSYRGLGFSDEQLYNAMVEKDTPKYFAKAVLNKTEIKFDDITGDRIETKSPKGSNRRLRERGTRRSRTSRIRARGSRR